MNIKIILFAVVLGVAFVSCNKEGEGGTSVIKGIIIGQDYSDQRSEVTEIIMTNGLEVEHGDYWLLNSPNTDSYFYIWYNNPTWVTNGNPSLNGRTGISVAFNYSDSNTDIATNTLNAILSASNLFDIELFNDILRITNIEQGDTPDANEVTSPFEINIDIQGEDKTLGEKVELIDEKIYITYGQNEVYNDEDQTGQNGAFQFTNLTKGVYVIHTFTKDANSGEKIEVKYETTISENKSVVDLGVLDVLF